MANRSVTLVHGIKCMYSMYISNSSVKMLPVFVAESSNILNLEMPIAFEIIIASLILSHYKSIKFYVTNLYINTIYNYKSLEFDKNAEVRKKNSKIILQTFQSSEHNLLFNIGLMD